MAGTPKAITRTEVARASSSDSTISVVTVDEASNAQSSSSTPPTSIGDTGSISSSLPLEKTDSTPTVDFGGRSRRQRTSVGTYNVKVLSGTAIHAPKKYCKNKPETGNGERRRTISGATPNGTPASGSLVSATSGKNTNRHVSDGFEALNIDFPAKKSYSQNVLGESSKKTPKAPDTGRGKSSRVTGEPSPSKKSTLGKRNRDSFDGSSRSARAERELARLRDTDEFAKIDTKPVIYEVWKNGKLVVDEEEAPKPKAHPKSATRIPAQLQAPLSAPAPKDVIPTVAQPPEVPKVIRKKEKAWLPMGLYAGQVITDNLNWFKGYKGPKEVPDFRPGGVLPLPMWHGQRLLFQGRDFKLPFDVCAPLPPGQEKPDEWRKTSTSKLSFLSFVFKLMN